MHLHESAYKRTSEDLRKTLHKIDSRVDLEYKRLRIRGVNPVNPTAMIMITFDG